MRTGEESSGAGGMHDDGGLSQGEDEADKTQEEMAVPKAAPVRCGTQSGISGPEGACPDSWEMSWAGGSAQSGQDPCDCECECVQRGVSGTDQKKS